MATNREHQAAYRRRHLHSPETIDAARVNLVVSLAAKAALRRLARHYSVSQRAMLEKLVADAERAVSDTMDGLAWTIYCDGAPLTA